MNKIHWLVQSNLLDMHQIGMLVNTIREEGGEVIDAQVIPFCDEVQCVIPDDAEIIIPYGSTKLTKLAMQQNWTGTFFIPEKFRTDTWCHYRNDMLNDGFIMTVREAMTWVPDDDDTLYFIRPVEDLKHFNGTVTTGREISRWMSSVESGNFSFKDDTEVMIAQPQVITQEWRFFIVDGRVISGSSYRVYGQRIAQPVTDTKLMETAQELANKWLPHPTCVMDVAETPDGLRVIEFNCFNSSGFYFHDIRAIVRAVHTMLESTTCASCS